MTQDLEADVRERLLHTDIGLLNDHNVSDNTMMMMAAEHGARVETLCKAIDPTRGRAVALMIANHLLEIVKEIGAATTQEPELICV